jgi:hypothetical protein
MTRIVLALALALAPLAAHAAAKSGPPTPARATAALPVTVQGALPGYTDLELAQLVKACAAGPMTNSAVKSRRGGWQLRITLDSEYMPRPATRVTASLVRKGRTIAIRWARVEPADAIPSEDLCETVTDLTWQIGV